MFKQKISRLQQKNKKNKNIFFDLCNEFVHTTKHCKKIACETGVRVSFDYGSEGKHFVFVPESLKTQTYHKGICVLLPTYSHVKECEQEVLGKLNMPFQSWKDDISLFHPDSYFEDNKDDTGNSQPNPWVFKNPEHYKYFSRQWKNIEPMLSKIGKIDKNNKKFIFDDSWLVDLQKLCDDNITWYVEALFAVQAILANGEFTTFQKIAFSVMLITRKPFGKQVRQLVEKIMHYFCGAELQSEEENETEGFWEKLLTNFGLVKDHPLAKKITKVLSFVSLSAISAHLGVDINDSVLLKCISSYLKGKNNFFASIAEVVIEFIKRLGNIVKTGSWSSFLHTEQSYGKWEETYHKLKRWSIACTNPEPHGFSYFQYLSELDDAIEIGRAIWKNAAKDDFGTPTNIKRMVMDLEFIKSTEITKKSAQEARSAPYGVLVFGPSGIAKSQLTDLLFHYYGNLFNLPTESTYRYVRNPVDEYWTNFSTSKWCVQLDDIAFMHPNIASQGDPSVMEMLQVVNNVPFVPTQADLADKGRTPCKAELVIATTNRIDMHAASYFSCPLAVQRRLPYVLSVSVKQEFRREGSHMADPIKMSQYEGVYPNFWNIKVCSVKPHDGDSDKAELLVVQEYTEIMEFLKDFGKNCQTHKNHQSHALKCSEKSRRIDVCSICCIPREVCDCVQLQAQEGSIEDEKVVFTPWITLKKSKVHIIYSLYDIFVSPYVMFCIFILTYKLWSLIGSNKVTRRLFGQYIVPRLTLRQTGALMERRYTIPKQKEILMVLGVFVTCSVCFMFYNTKDKKEEKTVLQTDEDVGVESSLDDTVNVKFKKEEMKNVWYNATDLVQEFHVPIASRSFAQADEKFDNILKKNISTVQIRNGSGRVVRTTMLFLRGNIAVVNNHAMKGVEKSYHFTIRSCSNVGVADVISVNVSRFQRLPNSDMCILYVPGCPPRADIIKYIACSPFRTAFDGHYLIRDKEGKMHRKEVKNLDFFPKMQLNDESGLLSIYHGYVHDPTQVGDCGSPLIAHTMQGPVICGIHVAGLEKRCSALHFDKEEIVRTITLLERESRVVSFEPNMPMMQSESKDPQFEPQIHSHSVFRWLEEGSIRTYGSFKGFRARPRSHVEETKIRKDVEVAFQVDSDYGKPVMTGWEVWRKNVEAMVNNDTVVDVDILDKCVTSFTKDILDAVNLEDSPLAVLTNRQAVNGIDGVRFIDKMNRKSSMGFPWKTKKSQFLTPFNDGTTDVDFPSEIWKRVDNIIKNYHSKVRASPIFSASLKDCPTSRKDIDSKKTRIFAAAPIDWSLVVRKYLLSFTKMVQENMYIFEAGPGTVTQSLQWQNHYNYITQFGTNNIVAGDYSKYDKRMQAIIILAAFQIIIAIHEAAGWNSNQINVLWGIAYDTAYSFVDFNGTLVEFFGTNPSGHPLTVIINSLANSLYMRYCYCVLNPAKECVTFKENVALMTYGDDNIMSVHDRASWFNHTAIQTTLDTIGVQYTMADKEAASVPYISIDETSFLKRKWVWNDEVGAMLAPLESKSIFRMLSWRLKTDRAEALDYQDRFTSALLESFFHGREFFNKVRDFLIFENERHQLLVEPSIFHTWDYYLDMFHSRDNKFPLLSFGHGLAHVSAPDSWTII